MMRSPSSLPLVCLLAVGLASGCEPDSHRFDAVDEPFPEPAALAEQRDDGKSADTERRDRAMSPDKAAECGYGTGRTAEGTCVQIHLDDAGYIQRVYIPSGDFVQGYAPERYDASASRAQPAERQSGQPPHTAHVEGFWIDLHEVPRRAYGSCVDKGSCTKAVCPRGDDPAAELSEELAGYLPQTCVTHAQAEAFCRAHGGRLPSESEWEYAARGVDARMFPWGNDIRDELRGGLRPAGRTQGDMSYFGILGMGSNAAEWVADRYDADASLRRFLSGEFRDPKGPLARTRRAFERELACGHNARSGCRAPTSAPERHVVKGTRTGARTAARAQLPAHPPSRELEGWTEFAHHPRLGFRCAADFDKSGALEPLTVPDPPPGVPLVRRTGTGLEVFGGVAEAVSLAEAKRFCTALRFQATDKVLSGWRLPTRAEVKSIADSFRGPGPFWTSDGAIAQKGPGSTPVPTDPWEPEDARDDEALTARCVRGAD